MLTGIQNIQVTSITTSTSSEAHIDLWSSADIVITDDHDALTGQTLMRPGAAVLEVMRTSTVDDAHHVLAMKTGIHHTASRLPHWELEAAACHGNAECVEAIKHRAARIEDASFRVGLRELFRKMGFAHHCKF